MVDDHHRIFLEGFSASERGEPPVLRSRGRVRSAPRLSALVLGLSDLSTNAVGQVEEGRSDPSDPIAMTGIS